jgi:hypothetical protein
MSALPISGIDPQGVKWETFLTTGASTVYGADPAIATASPCCGPKAAA